jgi:hypothetical protein
MSRDLAENPGLTNFFHWIFAWERQIFDDSNTGEPAGAKSLVELVWDDRVLDQKLEGNDLECIFVGGFEDDRAGGSGLLDLQPAGGTDAPAIARLEAGETELRHGGAEIIAQRLGGFKEWSVDEAADGVDAMVFGTGLATAGAVEASHGLAAADVERLAEDVFAAVLDGFNGGHRFYFSPLRAPTADCADARIKRWIRTDKRIGFVLVRACLIFYPCESV